MMAGNEIITKDNCRYFTNYVSCHWLSLFCPWLFLVCPWLSRVCPWLSRVSSRMSLIHLVSCFISNKLTADPGEARAALQPPSSLTDWFIHPLVKISLQRRQTQTVSKSAFSHKTNYIDIFSVILNLEGHQTCCIVLKVTAILLNGWILAIAGAASGRVCACSLHSRLDW